MPDTPANLLDAAEGENYEWTDMYADLANCSCNAADSGKLFDTDSTGKEPALEASYEKGNCLPFSGR